MFGLENSVVDSLMIRSENHQKIPDELTQVDPGWARLTQIDLGLPRSMD